MAMLCLAYSRFGQETLVAGSPRPFVSGLPGQGLSGVPLWEQPCKSLYEVDLGTNVWVSLIGQSLDILAGKPIFMQFFFFFQFGTPAALALCFIP